MAQVILKRGTSEDLEKEAFQDGLLSFTTDDRKIHLDYIDSDNNEQRITFYGGKLVIGRHIYDGSKDVVIGQYEGEVTEDETSEGGTN